MSARDDYPLDRVAARPATYEMDPGTWHTMCDELDRLRVVAQAARDVIRASRVPGVLYAIMPAVHRLDITVNEWRRHFTADPFGGAV